MKKEPPASGVSKGVKPVDDRDGITSPKSTKTKNPDRKRDGITTKRKPADAPQKDTPAKKRSKIDDTEEPAKTGVGKVSRTNQSSIKSKQRSTLKKKPASESESLIASTVNLTQKNPITVSKNTPKSPAPKVVAKPSLPAQRSPAAPDHSRDEQDEGSASSSEAESHDEESAHLHGFSSGDDDSSDEDGELDGEPPAIDVSKLPTIAKDDEAIKQRLEKAKRQPVRANVTPLYLSNAHQ
jgi:nucleolar protein 15